MGKLKRQDSQMSISGVLICWVKQVRHAHTFMHTLQTQKTERTLKQAQVKHVWTLQNSMT